MGLEKQYKERLILKNKIKKIDNDIKILLKELETKIDKRYVEREYNDKISYLTQLESENYGNVLKNIKKLEKKEIHRYTLIINLELCVMKIKNTLERLLNKEKEKKTQENWDNYRKFLIQVNENGLENEIRYLAQFMDGIIQVLNHMVKTIFDKDEKKACVLLLDMINNTTFKNKRLAQYDIPLHSIQYENLEFDGCKAIDWNQNEFKELFPMLMTALKRSEHYRKNRFVKCH